MLGYSTVAADSTSVFSGSYLRTGDLGWMDADYFLHVVDRAKDMIISGGENVYSAEVENAVYKHPAVRECAVIGVPDETWGEAVLAIVILKQGMSATEADIIMHCRNLIANFKCPKRVDLRDGSLPLSPAGKIKKDVLRAPYWESMDRRIS
jgi:long-chain acyl-CoA synthetase